MQKTYKTETGTYIRQSLLRINSIQLLNNLREPFRLLDLLSLL